LTIVPVQPPAAGFPSLSVKGDGKIYCIVSASDGVTSEAAITAKGEIPPNKTHYFNESVGVFWGKKELHATTNNLTVTYNCFREKDNEAFAKALEAMSKTAKDLGGSAGEYGWAFGLGAVATSAAAAAVQAAAKDEVIINAQHTVEKKKLLDLTNGRSWTLRQKNDGGIFGVGAWDFELHVQSWGCAEAKGVPR
jgi:hypothetical protein